MGKDEFEVLLVTIQKNTASPILDLNDKDIDSPQAEQLATALQANTSVLSLNLDRNPLGNAGASALARMLKINTTLRILSMVNASIGDEGGIEIASAISANTGLHLLNLAANSLGTQAGEAIIQALPKNSTLHTIVLDYNKIDAKRIGLINSLLFPTKIASESKLKSALKAVWGQLETLSTLSSQEIIKMGIWLYFGDYKQKYQECQILLTELEKFEDIFAAKKAPLEKLQEECANKFKIASEIEAKKKKLLARAEAGDKTISFRDAICAGTLQERFQLLKVVVVNEPNNEDAHYRLGNLYSMKSDFQNAIRHYKSAALLGHPHAEGAIKDLSKCWQVDKNPDIQTDLHEFWSELRERRERKKQGFLPSYNSQNSVASASQEPTAAGSDADPGPKNEEEEKKCVIC